MNHPKPLQHRTPPALRFGMRRVFMMVAGTISGLYALAVAGFLADLWLDERAKVRNTEYTARYSEEAFDRIAPGESKTAVIAALGEPFQISEWGDDVQMIFSRPKVAQKDFEALSVILDQKGNVVQTRRDTTD